MRRWLAAVSITMASVLGLAACGGGGAGQATQAPAASGGGKKQVEVFSWWTGPGEADGLQAMRKIFEEKNPDYTFFDAAVAGGSGDKAKALLQSKLQANTPPDTFQGHAGAELQGYIKAGNLEDLTPLYDELKLKDVFPAQLVEQISVDGKIYSVPVNIHRSNVLWFNPGVLKEAGITAAPKTIEEFIADLGKVKAKGKIPLSIGSEWTATHLLESVLLGTLGADAYNALFKPGADWNSPQVTTALNNFAKIMEYAGDPQDDWQPAAKQVADGQAAFNIMGDWAYGYFHNPPQGGLGKKSKTDFDWAPSPGTEGTYLWLSDSFTLPKGAKNRDGALAWLKVAASKEGQDAFNPKKGSIPARKDADQSLYTDYLADALKDWSTNKLAGSIQHGVSVNQPWLAAINEAVGLYIGSKDVKALQQGLADAATANAQ
ncbi:extracellular solute-binding protein, family 1 [[Actinomadura] parvosata subsp. kistnae]|uniref:Probable sugar-binding periplasmic protein n=1 Tax=[Actinomadura] parvosata subsp. kistnae TaxID=1909395 RepID=A0A1V0AG55_9ACTN|nr:extracellular solute-binding protein [Nonomuraea sp. ATCC 55076]AQZ69198.1 ABC transporter substrate-binding protein [Nonomuraea sp. ATCC 55076]SPL92196.1 extracellular solute-binding protein, family 1 [Actinomadura parvosata subsp. kistnae]